MNSDHNIIHGSTLCASGRLRGGATMSATEATNAFGVMSAQLQQLQTALAAEQATTADLRQNMNRGGESGGIMGGIRRRPDERHLPEEVHHCAGVWQLQVVGQRHERGPLWHDKSIKELIEYFDSTWITDQKLPYEEIGKCCANRR